LTLRVLVVLGEYGEVVFDAGLDGICEHLHVARDE
jgi:hypothetical protein